MSIRKTVTPPWTWPEKFGITAGERVGDTIYLSGMLAFEADGTGIPVAESLDPCVLFPEADTA